MNANNRKINLEQFPQNFLRYCFDSSEISCLHNLKSFNICCHHISPSPRNFIFTFYRFIGKKTIDFDTKLIKIWVILQKNLHKLKRGNQSYDWKKYGLALRCYSINFSISFGQFVNKKNCSSMFLKLFLRNLQTGSRLAQASVDTTRRTMQTNFADYTRFSELLGNLKVSEKFVKSENFVIREN